LLNEQLVRSVLDGGFFIYERNYLTCLLQSERVLPHLSIHGQEAYHLRNKYRNARFDMY
jgi:hypothetical protein